MAHGPVEHDLRTAVEGVERSARLQVGDVRHVHRHRMPGLADVEEEVAEHEVVPQQAHVGLAQPEGGGGTAHAIEVALDGAVRLQIADPIAFRLQAQTRGQGEHPEGRNGILVRAVHRPAVRRHVEVQVLGPRAHLMGVEDQVVADESVGLDPGRGLLLGGAHHARAQC